MGLCNAIVMLQAATNIYIYNDERKHQNSVEKVHSEATYLRFVSSGY